MSKIISIAAFISFVALSVSQECDPNVVEWFPHQYSCQKYVLCFHGNPLERSCAPGLDFSATELKCMFPADAKCGENFICPPEDDVLNPIFLPDQFDCQRFFVCFRGSPIQRSCADGFWWDVVSNWCTTADKVTCDERTSNNPNEVVPTTEAMTTIPRDPPVLAICGAVSHLFNPETGSYMKSSCVVRQNLNYEQGEGICQANNMNLFIIDDSFVQSTFFRATTNTVSVWYPTGFLWINGRREPTGEWMTFNPTEAPLYSGVDWVQTNDIDGRTSGDCLRFSSVHTPYRAMGFACVSLSYAVCEFFSEPQLNTAACLYDSELTDDNGNYLKSSCIINQVKNHWDAEEFCRDNGMHLFVINNSTVQAAFHATTMDLLLSRPNGHVWINGRNENDEWVAYDPSRVSLYDDVEWLLTDTIDGRTSGECLKYSQQFSSSYLSKGEVCSDLAWFVCEH